MENCPSVTTQQPADSSQQRATQQGIQQERLLAEQQNCLQLFCLTRNGNGATYKWYKDRIESPLEGTCKWFLQHENFKEWLSQGSGPLLVSADPGSGKSVLAKYLTDHGLAQQSATICYFFFNDQYQNTIRQALCALLHQLFTQKRALIQHAMKSYNNMGAALVRSEAPLWTILRDAVRDPQAGPVILVLDALDECDESQLSSFMTDLEDIFFDLQRTNARFKVLMTSHPYQRVVSQFDSLQAVSLPIHIRGKAEFQTISREINSAINYQVEQLAATHRLSDKSKSSLNSKLLSIDHRTYLWVRLVFNYLDMEFKNNDDGIDAAIKTLPKNVNEAYDRILNRSQHDDTVKTVKKALSIILAARRPLTLSEMNIALNLNGQGQGQSIYGLDLGPDVGFKSRLQALCGLLVSVHDDRIYFLHQTAREFLTRSSAPSTVSSQLQWHCSITTHHAHAVLADICMFYVARLNSTDTGMFCQCDHYGALLQYTVEHWGDHCREAGFQDGSATVDFSSEDGATDLTSHSQWPSSISRRYHISPKDFTNVLISSHFGLTSVTESLLRRGADIKAIDSWKRTALMLAAESGHEDVTRLLLENGADIKARDADGWTALLCAAMHDRRAIVRLLLENGADAKAKDDLGWAPLMHAAKNGLKAILRLLLDNGADMEAKDDQGTTALMVFARDGHEAATRLLLEYGANVETKDNRARRALMYSAIYGHEALTQLLLKNGAELEARDADGGTALLYAATYGCEAVTRLLLDKGANVNATDICGWTVLLFTAIAGHEAVFRLLLEKGADIEAQDANGRTALIITAVQNDEAALRLLIDNGAQVEARDNMGLTALLTAAHYGHEDAAQLLIDNGAQVEARDKNGMTALLIAAKCGHEGVARVLLDNGAKVETRDANDMTALMIAAQHGRVAATRLLLQNGADIEAKDGQSRTVLVLVARYGNEAVLRLLLEYDASVEARDEGMTALMIAIERDHEGIARLLLGKGIDIDAKDSGGLTALLHAVDYDRQAITRLLLENNADVEAKDGYGSTALMHAARFGYEAIAQMLLEKGANVGTRGSHGNTAWIHAARYGYEDVAQLLLAHGAQVDRSLNNGIDADHQDDYESVRQLLFKEEGIQVAWQGQYFFD